MAATRHAITRLLLAFGGLGTTQEARGQAGTPGGLDLFLPGPAAAPETIALGRRLFFDPILSRDSTVSCASCHRPGRAFTDGARQARGIGGRAGRRNVPTLINRGYGTTFSWDGRGRSLPAQALRAIQDSAEMDLPVRLAVERLAQDRRYTSAFQAAFLTQPSAALLGEALAAYVRSIRAGSSRFDRFVEGDSSALTPLEREGLSLFQGRARCDRCHTGPLLTDEGFHNTGVAWRGTYADSGRFRVTGLPADLGAFKTPTLREVERTAPYMHDGSLATLEAVVDFYAGGGNPNPGLDRLIRPIPLRAGERAALVAFLRALSGKVVANGQ